MQITKKDNSIQRPLYLLFFMMLTAVLTSCNYDTPKQLIDIHEHDNNLKNTKDSIEKYIKVSNNKLPDFCKYQFGKSYADILFEEAKNNPQILPKENNFERILISRKTETNLEYELYLFLGQKLVSFGYFEEGYNSEMSRNYHAFNQRYKELIKTKGYCHHNGIIDNRDSSKKQQKRVDNAVLSGEYIEYCLWKYDSFDYSLVLQKINIGKKDVVAVLDHYQDVKAIHNYYAPALDQLDKNLKDKTKAKVVRIPQDRPLYLFELKQMIKKFHPPAPK